MRPLAVLEQHILAILRTAPRGLNYKPISARVYKLTGVHYPNSRILTHLTRLESLDLVTSRVEDDPTAPGTRTKRIYKIRDPRPGKP